MTDIITQLKTTTTLLIGIAFLITGCGGGGGAIGGAASSVVKVADGYIQGAIVFLDENKNGVKDPTEPVAINTNPAIGEYTFKGISQATLDLSPIVVTVPVGATDSDRPNQPIKDVFSMTAPAGGGVITPITTMIQSQLKNNPGMTPDQAQTSIKKAMGLPANSTVDLAADYVAQKAAGGADAANYAKVHKVAQSVATIVKKNQAALQNAAPKGTSQTTMVDLMMQKALAKLPTIVMKVDVAGAKFKDGSTGDLIGSGFSIDLNTLQQQLAAQKAKLSKPVLSLKGPSSITLVVDPAGTYTDQGATLHSNNPNLYTGLTVAVGGDVVDPTLVGAYTLTYNVTPKATTPPTPVPAT
ncbi:MAG: hypothetical protein Q9M17_10770, partial [Mariprofundus sp.]|nr:hypothetical protein [Mariprofundus sp.]